MVSAETSAQAEPPVVVVAPPPSPAVTADGAAPVLMIVGVSHRNAPLAVREALAFAKDDLPSALDAFRRQAGLEEVMILSTCNRVEIYASGPRENTDTLAALLRAQGRAPGRVEPFLHRLIGDDAVRHAFRVASGLDSMVVGEPQILGQLKEAYDAAEKAGTLGSALGTLRQRSLTAAKRVRTETGIGRHAVSVSHVAVELARKIFGDLKGRRVLMVGAGKMSRLAARRLRQGGASAVVMGRTLARAEELAKMLGGRPVDMGDLAVELAKADIVISSTAAPCAVISRAAVEAARASRGGQPLFLVDIAVPRDIDPSVRDLPGVFLYDLDDLKTVSESNLRERRREASAAEAVAAEEAAAFLDWQRSQRAVPLLVALRQRGERIRRAEVDKARGHMGDLTSDQVKALEAVTAAIVSKLLHAPTVQLKELARTGESDRQEGLVRAILGLV